MRLIMLTGQRRSEIAEMEWGWVDAGQHTVEIPAARYKTKRPHVFPLCAPAWALVQSLPRWNGGDCAFSTGGRGRPAGARPISGFSKAKQVIGAKITELDAKDGLPPMDPWTVHDIRRSVATHMARSGVPQEHIERVLGHVVQGVAGTYMARRGAWRLPVLTGIATTPTMRVDGTVVSANGYDAASGLIIDTQGVAFPSVSEAPTHEDGRTALDTLIEVISEFPFVSDDGQSPAGGVKPSQSRSVALAMIITAVARPMFSAAPMFGTSAPTMATGKSLLADVPAIIVTGRRATKMSQGASEEEDEKRFLSVLMQGDPVNVIDNIARPIEGDALCTILTEETWRCRILGRSEMRDVGTRALFIATGNNLSFRNDMASRAVLANLDAELERPGERVFRRDLKTYVPEHRAELAAAALTVLRSFIAAGRPKAPRMEASRFEDWGAVRAALIWLGEPDPWKTNERVAVGDEARAEHADLMQAIGAAFGFGEFLSTTQILERAHGTDVTAMTLHLALATALPHGVSAPGLGRFLKKFADRRVDGMWIKASPNEKKGGRYGIMTHFATIEREAVRADAQEEMFRPARRGNADAMEGDETC